jgi:hypothetical protein
LKSLEVELVSGKMIIGKNGNYSFLRFYQNILSEAIFLKEI